MTDDLSSCPPARVRVPIYVGANVLPDGRVCVWDDASRIIVEGKRSGLQQRVTEAARKLDAARANRINQTVRELR